MLWFQFADLLFFVKKTEIALRVSEREFARSRNSGAIRFHPSTISWIHCDYKEPQWPFVKRTIGPDGEMPYILSVDNVVNCLFSLILRLNYAMWSNQHPLNLVIQLKAIRNYRMDISLNCNADLIKFAQLQLARGCLYWWAGHQTQSNAYLLSIWLKPFLLYFQRDVCEWIKDKRQPENGQK